MATTWSSLTKNQRLDSGSNTFLDTSWANATSRTPSPQHPRTPRSPATSLNSSPSFTPDSPSSRVDLEIYGEGSGFLQKDLVCPSYGHCTHTYNDVTLKELRVQLRAKESEVDRLRKRETELLEQIHMLQAAQIPPQSSQANISSNFAPPASPRSGTSNRQSRIRSSPQSPVSPSDGNTPGSQHAPVTKPRNVHELKALMAKAIEPGNQEELRKVKLLCAQAHRIPCTERDEVEKHVTMKWRNPNVVRSGYDSGMNNPQVGDPVDEWFRYYSLHKTSWPRGLRADSEGNPVWEDLEMRCLVNRFRPKDGAEKFINRNLWLNAVWGLFADEGLYQRLITDNNMSIGRFIIPGVIPFEGKDTSPREIASHFARCGVSLECANKKLAPWSKRNLEHFEVMYGEDTSRNSRKNR